jgi:hypothetical protein
VVAELAAAGGALTAEVSRPFAPSGAALPFIVRSRRMGASDVQAIGAVARCGERPAQSIRLWPGGERGVFTGTLPAEGTTGCIVTVTDGDDRHVVAGLAVSDVATTGVSAVLTKLERVARATGGVTASAGDVDPVVKTLASAGVRAGRTEAFHPMRSPWWMSPFVACLGIEWWLRRRAGLR